MGALMTTDGNNITGASGWHLSTVSFMMGASDTCIMPYVSEVTICDGITNIGAYAFTGDTSLSKITMTNGIKTIGEYAFMYDTKLSSITIPNGVTSIGNSAFYECTSLTSINIPSSVTSINAYAFHSCTSLSKIKIMSIYPSNLEYGDPTNGDYIFSQMPSNAVIYVLNEEMKAKMNEVAPEVTVQVVTQDEMNKL